MIKRAFVLAAFMLLAGRPAIAQDDHPVGLTMGTGGIGLIWHVSDDMALRPEITISRNQTASSSSAGVNPTTTSTSWGYSAGLSALVYLRTWEGLRTYLSPRLMYGWGDTSASPSVASSSTHGYFVSGSFGAQYRISTRFAVFGEAGISYSHQKNKTTTPSIAGGPSPVQYESTSQSWGPRTGIGAAFYF